MRASLRPPSLGEATHALTTAGPGPGMNRKDSFPLEPLNTPVEGLSPVPLQQHQGPGLQLFERPDLMDRVQGVGAKLMMNLILTRHFRRPFCMRLFVVVVLGFCLFRFHVQ